MSRYRTIRGVLQYIRARDPESAITEYFLRQLILNEELRYKRAGTKYLIDLDDIEAYFERRETERE